VIMSVTQSVKPRMASSGMLRRVTLVKTDISEELTASIIRVTRIGELGMLAVTSNRRTLRRNTKPPCHPDEGGAKFLGNVGSQNCELQFH
jgi:demethoxyubiquinone hydroxylase (CLK1/Coq7/Cat5 family)